MISLPVDRVLGELRDSLGQHGAVVLEAPPGTGKTTRVPPALATSGAVDGAVWVLEPRRIAARAAARRVAQERGWTVGGEVGFQVRGERQVSAATKVCFVTEGVLVRRMLQDPELPGIGCVVLDEFHERHIEGDLAISMLQEVRETLRPDLSLVVMSATLQAGPLREFLPSSGTVVARAEVFPVEVIHRPCRQGHGLRLEPREVAEVIGEALGDGDGDVLVFLPGVGEIESVAGALKGRVPGQVQVLPLHGRLSPKEQDAALRPSGSGQRVVLSTNLAESSLTVPGVTAVVDSGLARVLRNNPQRGIDTLSVERISLASAEQRRGRAGRIAPGRCYRLWSAADSRRLAPHEDPDVARIDLAGAALTVHGFAGKGAQAFGWFEAPHPAAWERAEALLRDLGAVDPERGTLTDLGLRLQELPLHPRLGRMVLAGESMGVAEEVRWLAALLDEADFAPSGASAWTADVSAWAAGTLPGGRSDVHGEGLPRALARRVKDSARRLGKRRAARQVDASVDPDIALTRAVLAGWPDRVVQRSAPPKTAGGERGAPARQGVMVGGRGVTLPAAADNAGDLLVAVELLETQKRADRSPVGRFCAVSREDLESVFPDALAERQHAVLQRDRGRVVARHQVRFRDLVLRDAAGGSPDPVAALELLCALLAEDPWKWIDGERDLRLLLGRIAWLRGAAPDLGVPEIGDLELALAAGDALAGATDLGKLHGKAVAHAVQGRFLSGVPGWQRHAPEKLELPSGRHAVIDYGDPGGPTVGARIQELFGCRETPRIAGGRVPLVLSILGPNHRPVQVTRDLSSFWANLYPEVRRELSRRYPRHSWPEDPLAASPESRPRPRRRR